MIKCILTFSLFTLSFYSYCQSQKDLNLDFETYNISETLADGWFKWGTYEVGTDTNAHSGKYAAMVKADENGSTFGAVAYQVPAGFKGKTIRLEGFMKVSNVSDGFAGLLLRIDRDGQSVAFDNMENQKISGTKDWQKYIIELPYLEDTDDIIIGGIVSGKGIAWFDDFTITIDGKDIKHLERAPKVIAKADLDSAFDNGSNIKIPQLNGPLITNLELLGRIWGFLKYHHPEIAKGNYNWDYELFRFLPEYIKVTTMKDRDKLLIKWIDQYGAVAKCIDCKSADPNSILKPDHTWIQNGEMIAELKNKLTYIYQNRHQGKHFYIKLSAGASNPEFLNEKEYSTMPYPDDGFRLLALYKYWNMIHYFFPYKHLMDKNWNTVLKEHIPSFINATNELDYELAALLLIGDLQDTHANLWAGNNAINDWKGRHYPPMHLRFIENKLVVTDYYNPELKEKSGMEIGDVITKINGVDVEQIVANKKKYYPASNSAARLRDIANDLLRSNDQEVQIDYISNSISNKTKLTLYDDDKLSRYRWYKPDTTQCYKLLDENIGYITLQTIKETDIPKIKETFKNTKGIIIDIRNYPATFVPFSLGSYFFSKSRPFVKFTIGNVNNPGEFSYSEPLEIPASETPYKGKVIVMVNELSQSQAEYTTMAFRAGDNTTVLGSTTAGADGNASMILLPGGLKTIISGIGIYYPDGKETQQVGIIPDVKVSPTINGIKNGKDELLEKAINLITQP